jgi:2-polyprenyl-3-methyl-5-hydroxy-6-metoxy-1,4-benzoquinol methylase
MRSRVARVIGIDPDPNCIALARTAPGGSNGEFVRADLFAYPAAAGSFDFITCVAALHHMEEERALRRMAVLLRPGGTLVVVGLAQSRLPADLRWEIAGAIATRLHKLTKNYGETTAPKVWPPPHTYDEMRDIFGRVLPGSRFRRVILWRYVATWTKPAP